MNISGDSKLSETVWSDYQCQTWRPECLPEVRLSEVQVVLGTDRGIKSQLALPASVSTARKGQVSEASYDPSHAHFTSLPPPLHLWFFWVLDRCSWRNSASCYKMCFHVIQPNGDKLCIEKNIPKLALWCGVNSLSYFSIQKCQTFADSLSISCLCLILYCIFCLLTTKPHFKHMFPYSSWPNLHD